MHAGHDQPVSKLPRSSPESKLNTESVNHSGLSNSNDKEQFLESYYSAGCRHRLVGLCPHCAYFGVGENCLMGVVDPSDIWLLSHWKAKRLCIDVSFYLSSQWMSLAVSVKFPMISSTLKSTTLELRVNDFRFYHLDENSSFDTIAGVLKNILGDDFLVCDLVREKRYHLLYLLSIVDLTTDEFLIDWGSDPIDNLLMIHLDDHVMLDLLCRIGCYYLSSTREKKRFQRKFLSLAIDSENIDGLKWYLNNSKLFGFTVPKSIIDRSVEREKIKIFDFLTSSQVFSKSFCDRDGICSYYNSPRSVVKLYRLCSEFSNWKKWFLLLKSKFFFLRNGRKEPLFPVPSNDVFFAKMMRKYPETIFTFYNLGFYCNEKLLRYEAYWRSRFQGEKWSVEFFFGVMNNYRLGWIRGESIRDRTKRKGRHWRFKKKVSRLRYEIEELLKSDWFFVVFEFLCGDHFSKLPLFDI